jgi:glucosyl-3-phosphoglycerate synthase
LEQVEGHEEVTNAGDYASGVTEASAATDRKGATRISLVVPARDEAATVGPIVERLRLELMERVPFVDELVVIDSDSTDRTAAIAADAGATVHAAGGIRPELGWVQGKGEALWKSQFVTTGDVLVFVDSDLVDCGPHFVTRLALPLLEDPGVQLVKAVYHRPLLDEAGHEVETGGRVTELVARPLLALHRPGLAGVVQPLSGEWAIRRSAFAAQHVPVGYGVEIAALVDVVDAFGAGAVAQAELGRRTPRHHRHDPLGPMALQVQHAVEVRLGVRPRPAFDSVVDLVQHDPMGEGFAPRVRHVAVGERPPARDVLAGPDAASGVAGAAR